MVCSRGESLTNQTGIMAEYGKVSTNSNRIEFQPKRDKSVDQSQSVAGSQWEYKFIRFDYKGRGITQEINLLDIDGIRVRGWANNKEVPTLPEMVAVLGKDGWEMISHMVNQDNVANGVTWHYINFKRPMR